MLKVLRRPTGVLFGPGYRTAVLFGEDHSAGLPDNAVITIEVDSSDPNAGLHRLWGVACLSGSLGYARNYLEVGAGVYIRELQMKVVPLVILH
jgi:hypothetical protein